MIYTHAFKKGDFYSVAFSTESSQKFDLSTPSLNLTGGGGWLAKRKNSAKYYVS